MRRRPQAARASVTERLLAELDSRIGAAAEELRSTGEARIARGLEELRRETAVALGAVYTAANDAARRIERSGSAATDRALEAARRIERQSKKLRRRARRHELRLVRRERSRRSRAALEKLEVRATEVTARLDAVVASAQGEVERGAAEADQRILDALAGVGSSLQAARAAEARALDSERRIGVIERRIEEIVRTLGTTIGWDERLGEATPRRGGGRGPYRRGRASPPRPTGGR